MKSKIFGLTLAAMLVSAAMPVSAQSVGTGKVNFNGLLTDQTCTITTGYEDQLVTLPTLSTKSLTVAAEVAGSTPFDILVEECPAALTQVRAHFEMTNMDAATRTLQNNATTGAAGNVTVQLVNADRTVIEAGSAGALFDVNATTHKATMTYGGQYYATAATTPGIVQSYAEFTLAYP